ncbi:MAG: hypothetical protein P4L52_03400 [Acidocella sp.]|nr:hypothetical protein [Acidocella sp.]
MTKEETSAAVPGYNDLVTRNEIEILQKPGDAVIRNNDFALTRWGDIMLIDEDYSAFFKLLETWRYNFPTLKVLFETSIDRIQHRKNLEVRLQSLFEEAAKKTPHPMASMDHEAYHRTNDEIGAAEIARGVYAGSIAIVLNNMLQAFRANIAATAEEWKKAAPLFDGCSVGQIVEASANNVRHAEEWQTARPPDKRQLNSIQVLATVLNEPLEPVDGSRHQFGREVSPETLQLLSGGDFMVLEANLFRFAQNMLKQRQRRMPSQT